MEDRGTQPQVEDRGTQAQVEDRGTQAQVEDRGTRAQVEDRGTQAQVEDRGTQAQVEVRGTQPHVEDRGTDPCLLDTGPDVQLAGHNNPGADKSRKYWLVQGRKDPLSNFYPCKIEGTVHGRPITYSCGEQAFQHKKALFLNDRETAEKILSEKDMMIG